MAAKQPKGMRVDIFARIVVCGQFANLIHFARLVGMGGRRIQSTIRRFSRNAPCVSASVAIVDGSNVGMAAVGLFS
jgi:hypothetical protein